MVSMTKRTGNKINYKKYDENGKITCIGFGKISDFDTDNSYVATLFCEKFCNKCYCFGTDWDKRCRQHDGKPIHQCVNECEHYLMHKENAKHLTEKMETDKDFEMFLKICNKDLHNTKRRDRLGFKNDLDTYFAIFRD